MRPKATGREPRVGLELREGPFRGVSRPLSGRVQPLSSCFQAVSSGSEWLFAMDLSAMELPPLPDVQEPVQEVPRPPPLRDGVPLTMSYSA